MSSSGQGSGSAGSQANAKPKGPPYAPQTWSLGGSPKKDVDIPVTAVFLVLFITSAVVHMTIFQINKKNGRKFLVSGLLFGFSMARITACVMRIASVSLPHDVPLALAANIFVAAGVVLLFVVNIIFMQRVIRAAHPRIGWHRAFEILVKILIALVVIMIIMVITVVIQSFYTLNPRIRQTDREIQLLGLTYFAFVSFLPIPVVILALLLPHKRPIDKFGEGSWRAKMWILLTASILLSFGASYRAGVQYLTPRSNTKMPIYPSMHKAAFYVVNFTVEILVLTLYAVARIDKRFHIPDGAKNGYRKNEMTADEESRPNSDLGNAKLYESSMNETKTTFVPGTPHTNKSRFSGEAPSVPHWPMPPAVQGDVHNVQQTQHFQTQPTRQFAPDKSNAVDEQMWSEYGGMLPRTPRTEERLAALRRAHLAADAGHADIQNLSR